MKQIYIETQAKDQVYQNFGDTNSEIQHSIIREHPDSDFLNIFLIQNKGKGPPGRSRSPGVGHRLFPEHPPDESKNPVRFSKPDRIDEHKLKNPSNGWSLSVRLSVRQAHSNSSRRSLSKGCSLSLSKGKINLNTEIQINHKVQNFYKHLIFKIMKKQILFLAFFVLALILAGTKSYGQDLNYIPAPACANVTALPCGTDDALHPLPGKSYTYNVAVNPGVTTGYVQWFVYDATTTTAIITGGSMAAALTAAEVNTGASKFLLLADVAKYKLTTSTSGTIDVTWQSFDGNANIILLVAYVKGEGGCSDNIEVFRIKPNFAFTLDIAGLMPTGALPASGNAVECVSPVLSATYNGTNLLMDYGDNYVYFAVTAANFVHSWQPTFSIVANNTQSPLVLGDITWAYPLEAVKNTAGAATGTWNAATDPVLAVAASKAVGAPGECIIVRVHIDHGLNENDASAVRNVVIGVDGVMYNVPTTNYSNASLTDLDPSAAGSPCTNTVTDQAQYDLTPRPEVTTTVVAPGFEPKL